WGGGWGSGGVGGGWACNGLEVMGVVSWARGVGHSRRGRGSYKSGTACCVYCDSTAIAPRAALLRIGFCGSRALAAMAGEALRQIYSIRMAIDCQRIRDRKSDV